MSIVICIGRPTIERAAKGEMVEVGQGVTIMAADGLIHGDPYAALLNLANAADAIGVRFFDTDTMEPEVEAMQKATLAARELLK